VAGTEQNAIAEAREVQRKERNNKGRDRSQTSSTGIVRMNFGGQTLAKVSKAEELRKLKDLPSRRRVMGTDERKARKKQMYPRKKRRK